MERYTSTFLALLGCIAIVGMMIWTQPTCRDGYLASLFLEGWACVPGYKPARR